MEQKIRFSLFNIVLSLDCHCMYTTLSVDSLVNISVLNNRYKISFPGQLPHLWIMHILFSVLHTITNTKSFLFCFRFAALHSKMVFWQGCQPVFIKKPDLLTKKSRLSHKKSQKNPDVVTKKPNLVTKKVRLNYKKARSSYTKSVKTDLVTKKTKRARQNHRQGQ